LNLAVADTLEALTFKKILYLCDKSYCFWILNCYGLLKEDKLLFYFFKIFYDFNYSFSDNFRINEWLEY
jgi:hypothetical protein